MPELFLPKVPIWLKKSLEICIVLGGLVKVFECYGSPIVGVEGIKQLVDLLRRQLDEALEDAVERFSLKSSGVAVELRKGN